MRHRSFVRGFTIFSASLAALSLSLQPASAETRTYAVSWFTGASYNQDGDCVGGINIDIDQQYVKDLMLVGYTKEQAEEIVNSKGEGGQGSGTEIALRARIDGKHVNAYTNPAATPDPQLHAIGGKYAIGFNLDGKGAASPNSFEDPITHEQGINNQMFRATGCFQAFRGTDKTRPAQWSFSWDSMRAGTPAWLITISGADLGKDGDATVTFDRALEHVERDANGDVERDMTYRIDADPRSHNSYKAAIKNGMLTITEHGDFYNAMGELMMFPQLHLRETHLRMKLNPDGSLDGIIGGYQPWIDFWVWTASGAFAFENALGVDSAGFYHLLKKVADANPDPKTGQNRDISTAYRIEAVPAFLLPPEGPAKTAQAGH